MNSPWDNIDAAFDAFYDQHIAVEAKRPDSTLRQTLKVVVFNSMTGDVVSDEAIDTERRDIDISFKRGDWGFASSLRRGDSVKYGKRKYKVLSVEEDDMFGVVAHAREV